MLEDRISLLAERYRLPAEVREALIAVVREETDSLRTELPEDPDEEKTQFQPVPVRVVQVRGTPSRPPTAASVPSLPAAAKVDPLRPARPVVELPPKPAGSGHDMFDEPTQFLPSVVPAPTARAPRDPADRYEDLGIIGTGATGEVRRVRDTDLNRVMAMKILHPHLLAASGVVARFISEAQATAQLEHPGIIPVHAMGRLPDGRYYFTMKEVRGTTFGQVIHEVHMAANTGRWEQAPSGWTFRRLIEAYRKVAEAVGYAHARGVVHRDLKPENIMVGAFGEVVVMDWGLCKVIGADEPALDGLNAVETARSTDSAYATRLGSIAGTPTYMPPEQARGAHNEIGPAADVYALGAILYEILAGKPPYDGRDAWAVVAQVLDGPPPPPGRVETSGALHLPDENGGHGPTGGPPAIPAELRQICLRAIERAPEDRFPEAGALAAEVEAWLDGAKKREQAKGELDRARELSEEVAALRQQGAQTREQAVALLRSVRPNEPVERKRPGWSLEDRANRLDAKADLKEVVMTQTLQAALTFVADHTEAHDLLADYYRNLHAEAEQGRDRAAATRYEVLLQAHDTGRHTGYLKGDGAFTLITEPADAEVELCRFALFDRRLRTVPMRVVGKTPIIAMEIQRGAYLLKIRAPGRAEVRYPILIGREEHWDGVPPGNTEPFPVYLPHPKELGNNGVYVPAGWTWVGGDPDAPDALPRQRVWVDGFALLRFPVTNWEYIAYLDALVKTGREHEALRRAPRERGGTVGRPGAVIYGRDTEGRFVLRQDADGDRWEPTWPVVMLDWHSAQSFGAWYAARMKQPWRIPTALEWEKAARGVDGRFYPWGDYLDPTWCCMGDSHARRPTLAPVEAYVQDESPYGVHGLAGNARDWCLDAHTAGGPLITGHRAELQLPAKGDTAGPRYVRGGWWDGNAHLCRSAALEWMDAERRGPDVGFRLARPLNAPGGAIPTE